MREIFKNPRNIRKELILNMGCYEKIKREIYEKKTSLKDLDQSKVKIYSDSIKKFNDKKIYGVEKLSEQESTYLPENQNNQMIF